MAKVVFFTLFLTVFTTVFSQDNSPYSRFGTGDIVPNTNIVNRGMGGISAAYSDALSVNFSNPASYASFQRYFEERSKQSISGRVLLDVGLNFENRTLRNPNTTAKFTTSNALFSYINVGIPLRKNWGLSFGLKPVSRVSYKINERQKLSFDSVLTEYTGNGGSYLPSIGTGFAIKNLSLGVNMGYLFGRREISTRRMFLNDTVLYNNSNHTTRTYYGNLFFNAGAQYRIKIDKGTSLRLGASGNMEQTLKGSQDRVRETFVRDAAGGTGDVQLDSVSIVQDIKGDVVYPASYTVGFVVEHQNEKLGGWLIGADLIQSKWANYRFYGAKDAVQDSWQVRVGGQYRPQPKRNYFSNVAYRAGFFTGPDYINAGGDLPQLGVSAGLGLPIANYNRLSPGQYTILNLTLEYNKRGNNDNLLKENLFRVSVGLNFSDIWFNKRKYD